MILKNHLTALMLILLRNVHPFNTAYILISMEHLYNIFMFTSVFFNVFGIALYYTYLILMFSCICYHLLPSINARTHTCQHSSSWEILTLHLVASHRGLRLHKGSKCATTGIKKGVCIYSMCLCLANYGLLCNVFVDMLNGLKQPYGILPCLLKNDLPLKSSQETFRI